MRNQDQGKSSPTKSQKKDESPQNNDKIKNRKIPQTLIYPYDLINLHEVKKKRFNFKRSQSKQEKLINSELQKLKPLFGQCYCSEDPKQDETQTVYQLTPTLFVLSKVCSFRIRSISKIKLIGYSQGEGLVLKPTLLKLTWGDSEEQSCNIYIRMKSVEETYFLFASIISRKLLIEDFALVDLSKKEMKSFDGSIAKVQGEIYKISTFMRKWQKRQAKIQDSLKLYKQQKLAQEIKSIKQIWTRFNMNNGYFVVKMFQGIQKIELGIPLGDYYNIESQRNWLYLLAKLVR